MLSFIFTVQHVDHYVVGAYSQHIFHLHKTKMTNIYIYICVCVCVCK